MARVLMATSYDEQFPADNILSQPTRDFWMSTGVYPQEILIQLTPAKSLRSIRFVSTKVRQIVVEGSEGPHLGNFVKIGETEIGDSRDLQRDTVEINSNKVFQYVKFVIVSGWNDFVSIHSLRFE